MAESSNLTRLGQAGDSGRPVYEYQAGTATRVLAQGLIASVDAVSQGVIAYYIGDLTEPSASASLRVGQILFIGSNSCSQYILPSATSVEPVLSQLSATVHNAPLAEDELARDATYKAMNPGTTKISIGCAGDLCPGSLIVITVNVAPAP